jgi:sulfur-oxidizing protein SoxZ
VAEQIRIRARVKDGVTEAHVLMPHPMETGFRHDEAGRLIEAHYIKNVRIEVAGRPVLTARMGIAISADPLLTFRFRGTSPGERITATWTDNFGQTRTDEAIVA